MTESQRKTMVLVDSIRACGKTAMEDYKQLARERGLDDNVYFIREYTEVHQQVAQEIHSRWHTSTKFKVGDKVYVVPLTPTRSPTCIRATVTEVGDPRWGYHLRAFESDLPGIYMYNIWDKDLEPRSSKKQKPTPANLLVKD